MRTEDSDSFSEVEYKHENPVPSLDIHKYVMYITTHERKAPNSMLSRSKTPKAHSKLSIVNIQKSQ